MEAHHATTTEAGDKVTVNFIGGCPRAKQSVEGKVVEVSEDSIIVSSDLGRVFHRIDNGMVRSAKTRGNLGTRHGRTRGEFAGMEVTA